MQPEGLSPCSQKKATVPIMSQMNPTNAQFTPKIRKYFVSFTCCFVT